MGKSVGKLDYDYDDEEDNEFGYEHLMLELRQTHLSGLEMLHTMSEFDPKQGFDHIKEKDKAFFEEFCYIRKKLIELLKELDSKNY